MAIRLELLGGEPDDYVIVEPDSREEAHYRDQGYEVPGEPRKAEAHRKATKETDTEGDEPKKLGRPRKDVP